MDIDDFSIPDGLASQHMALTDLEVRSAVLISLGLTLLESFITDVVKNEEEGSELWSDMLGNLWDARFTRAQIKQCIEKLSTDHRKQSLTLINSSDA